MKFGKVEHPENIDFTIPKDHPKTKGILQKTKSDSSLEVYVGCAKWNRQDLKGFYPRGTKDELVYYSTQFNSIELNATFYRFFPPEQFEKWYEKTPTDFKFFPKLNQEISHWKRLNEVEESVKNYIYAASNLKEKLGTIFLQMHSNFAPKDMDKVVAFAENWPKSIALAIEFRHTDWYNDPKVAEELYKLLEENNIANVLVDTAGRRDLMHMRLTSNEAFIRYVGANHKSDYDRLDDWVFRLKQWVELGLNKIHFFVHQNLELASPLLSAHFIKNLNKELVTNLTIPKLDSSPNTLF
ncbi:DUF72 domain-containing protein [Aureibaculum sp. 2210JD6-5]|uniref:DUF72 domain-containing protein n=1 Tax=Aureibaculum sp. 2210JD6-5 TaxID=3103957 RepID=UPI002AAD257C|nr:DUF72 domain-containing protein [Aureibaculum sp. 2210JD6-5]MDY7395033.1 DUF72 domain-containing protein [Aureibaculum sp. 2210JD6-5]